jgi:biopolymer transport protein TolR
VTKPRNPFATGSARGARPEINVTPLVDVVLVLLIIFMVIAPQLEAGERVELPGVTNVAAKSELDAITVTVTTSGRYLVERDVVAEEELSEKLAAAHAAHPDKKLVIKGDRGARYGAMRRVFLAARALDMRGIALTVDERRPLAAK